LRLSSLLLPHSILALEAAHQVYYLI
jgi:hypothetical protein